MHSNSCKSQTFYNSLFAVQIQIISRTRFSLSQQLSFKYLVSAICSGSELVKTISLAVADQGINSFFKPKTDKKQLTRPSFIKPRPICIWEDLSVLLNHPQGGLDGWEGMGRWWSHGWFHEWIFSQKALWSKIEKKKKKKSHLIIHCPTSKGVSEVSERANE